KFEQCFVTAWHLRLFFDHSKDFVLLAYGFRNAGCFLIKLYNRESLFIFLLRLLIRFLKHNLIRFSDHAFSHGSTIDRLEYLDRRWEAELLLQVVKLT